MTIGRHRRPAPPLDLALTETADTELTLTAHGRLDADTVDDLTEAFQVVLTQPGLTRVLLDFGALTSVDSSGVAALAAAPEQAQRHGVAVTIVSCGAEVRRALELSGVYEHLTQAPTGAPHPRLPGPRRSDDAEALTPVTNPPA
ncbi:STAS domain-containing protein [Planosporangium mesophilum]|uniref:STAS domain-containing protein n=1 Tax=Planosporangium mesophilum TaxID=689768 RepID=A0A8J3THX4_9ACTN|nr:STAS domain-containing protein [Planosporangium mesophilum]NJC86349.1 STAS domain-containing protein [Planosporangium mesophilum]GII25856.1 hypothetical protein Pme01_54530 [Planosporangium mesophilum]